MTDLKVRVCPLRTKYDYGETIDLDVSVENVSSKRLFVVTPRPLRHYGPPYIWKEGSRRIGVMLAEAELTPGFCYYSYAPPALLSLPTGGHRVILVHIGMPPREGRIENNVYVWAETPVSGRVTIDVTVGYLRKKFQPNTSATWAEFLSLQEKLPPVRVAVYVKRK